MFESLVQAVAAGSTIKAWAEKHGQKYATVRHWARTPEFKAAVAEIRADMMDRYVGKVSAAMDALADGIVELAKNSQSDAVRVSAIRGCVADLIQVIGLAEVKAAIAETNARMDRLEKGIADAD